MLSYINTTQANNLIIYSIYEKHIFFKGFRKRDKQNLFNINFIYKRKIHIIGCENL